MGRSSLDFPDIDEVTEAIESIAQNDPDNEVKTEAADTLRLLRGSNQAALKTKALAIFTDESKSTQQRIRALGHLRRLLIRTRMDL